MTESNLNKLARAEAEYSCGNALAARIMFADMLFYMRGERPVHIMVHDRHCDLWREDYKIALVRFPPIERNY